jgi:hypothetical protein
MTGSATARSLVDRAVQIDPAYAELLRGVFGTLAVALRGADSQLRLHTYVDQDHASDLAASERVCDALVLLDGC